ncbi:MAG: DUF3140 domain-containing protein [Sphingomicrobium sp.]
MASVDRDQVIRDRIIRDFEAAVNMTAREIAKWLRTEPSLTVGFKGRDGKAAESVGHASGRRIVSILSKKTEALTTDDIAHMRKVVGFVRRHCAQRPADIYTSRWRYSLMNWGHDPTREG